MFNKKRKIRKYRVYYGKSPTLSKTKTGKRNYQKLSKRQNPTISKIKKLFTMVIVTTGLIILIYGAFFSNYLKIINITVYDQKFENELLTEEIKDSIKNALAKNIIFTDTDELELKIISLFPELEQVKVLKDYPNSLTVEFSEYPPAANVINESNAIKKNYIINSIGYTIKEDFEDPGLPFIKIKSDEPINTETPVIEGNKLSYILETIGYFEDKFGMKISEVQYKDVAREVHLLTDRGFYIWLDIQRSAEEQLKKLKKSLVKIDIYTENFEYIDLRIAGNNGDKIIYKRK